MNDLDQAVSEAIEILNRAGAVAVVAYLAPNAQSWSIAAGALGDQPDGGKRLLNEAANAVCQASKSVEVST